MSESGLQVIERDPGGWLHGPLVWPTFMQVPEQTAFKEKAPPAPWPPGGGQRSGVKDTLSAVCRWFSWITVRGGGRGGDLSPPVWAPFSVAGHHCEAWRVYLCVCAVCARGCWHGPLSLCELCAPVCVCV